MWNNICFEDGDHAAAETTAIAKEKVDNDDDESFDPFQTIQGDVEPAQDEGGFDPFASIHGEDAFVAHFPETGQLSGQGTPGWFLLQTFSA